MRGLRKGSNTTTLLSCHEVWYVCAFLKEALVGFVYVAWDGGHHAFLLDTTVRTDLQRQGIGSELVRRAADLARLKGVGGYTLISNLTLRSFAASAALKKPVQV